MPTLATRQPGVPSYNSVRYVDVNIKRSMTDEICTSKALIIADRSSVSAILRTYVSEQRASQWRGTGSQWVNEAAGFKSSLPRRNSAVDV